MNAIPQCSIERNGSTFSRSWPSARTCALLVPQPREIRVASFVASRRDLRGLPAVGSSFRGSRHSQKIRTYGHMTNAAMLDPRLFEIISELVAEGGQEAGKTKDSFSLKGALSRPNR